MAVDGVFDLVKTMKELDEALNLVGDGMSMRYRMNVDVELNNGTYVNLTNYLMAELEDRFDPYMEDIKWLASVQSTFGVIDGPDETETWAITFKYLDSLILNPFVGLNAEPCNPFGYYEKTFINSEWLTRAIIITTSVRMLLGSYTGSIRDLVLQYMQGTNETFVFYHRTCLNLIREVTQNDRTNTGN